MFIAELNYTVDDNVLSIGANKFVIDTIQNEILVLTEIPKYDLPDDKINHFVFLKRPYLFQYLKETNEIEIYGDTLIDCNNLFAPSYYGNLDNLFNAELNPHEENKNIIGDFILDYNGKIENIYLENNGNISIKEIKIIESIINKTKGGWIKPETPKLYKFKVNFLLLFSFTKPFSSVTFLFSSKLILPEKIKLLSKKEKLDADNFFFKGIDLFQNEKYDAASIQFLKALAINPLYLDAYYNLAYCYIKLNKQDLACETWTKLKNMGQKQAEKLIEDNCK